MEESNIEVVSKYNINFIPSQDQLDTILNDVKEKNLIK